MKPLSIIIPFILILIGACIDPLNVNIDREINILIVEGSITTQPGPYPISLFRSAKYGSIFEGYARPIERAIVSIRDSEGANFNLSESVGRPGIYFTDVNFIPKVGKSYTLLITTPDGTEYTSLPEKINKATGNLDLTARFTEIALANNQVKTGYEVYATFQDNPGEQNFYMWKNNGIYEPVSVPDYFTFELDCSDGKCLVRKSADLSIRVLNDIFINGNIITDQAAFIEDDGERFEENFLVRIEQHTLTREAYQFFNLLKNQISINGDVFDPPPATLRGNILNLTNPDENVIGYFRASDVVVDSIFLAH